MFNVAIIGLSAIGSYEQLRDRCIYLLKNRVKEGLTIYATEENPLLTRFSTEYRIAIQYFYTDWRAYGKKALRERNKQLLATCNGIIWFNDGLKDTDYLCQMAKSIGTPIKHGFKP